MLYLLPFLFVSPPCIKKGGPMQTSRDVWQTEIKRGARTEEDQLDPPEHSTLFALYLLSSGRGPAIAVERRLAVPICTFTAATANSLCCNCCTPPNSPHSLRMTALSHFCLFLVNIHKLRPQNSGILRPHWHCCISTTCQYSYVLSSAF